MTQKIYTHERFYRLQDAQPLAGAILTEHGRIKHIGSLQQVLEVADPDATQIALPGAAVLPVFHDAHIHTGLMALEKLAPDLDGATSLAEVLTRLREFAAAHPGISWVLGGRYDANKWECGSAPHRTYLDEIFGDRPVVLTTVDVHAGWANSAALELAQITALTPDPSGGKIVRDDSGEPTGLLLESALTPVTELAEAALTQHLPELLLQVQQDLLAVGIGHVTDIDDEKVLRAYRRMREQQRLHLRVHKAVRAEEIDIAITEGRHTGDGDDWITVGPVKFFSDGALGPHTAHMHEPFADEPDNCGIAVTDEQTLRREIRRANSAGLAVMVHAIGDKANTIALDVLQSVRDIAAEFGLRNRIEHAQHIKPADISRFKTLNVIASMQPCHATSDYPLSVNLLGARDTLHYPWRSLLDAGAHLAFGSDAPVEPANPFFEVHAAVTRQRRDDQPPGGREPEQRLDVLTALQTITAGPAYAAGLENDMGSLAVGKFADFIAVDTDPFTVQQELLWKIKVLTTVMGGEIVYDV